MHPPCAGRGVRPSGNWPLRGVFTRCPSSRAVDRYCPGASSPRSPLSSANVRLFLIPRKGEPRLWGHTSGLAFSRREQVLPQREAWPSPTITASACLGVHLARSRPLPAVPRRRLFAGKKPAGSGVRALWGQQWTRLPSRGEQVLPQRGARPSPPASGRGGAQLRCGGSMIGTFGPLFGTLRSCLFAGEMY
jgi:hypothetical protein